MQPRRGATRLGVAAALVLLACAGCTSRPAVVATPEATASPAPSYPSVQGRTLSSTGSDVEWHRTIRVADSSAAYAEARRLLVAGGYSLTKDRQGTGGGDGQACTPALCVDFTGTDIPGAGPILAYDVFHPKGIVG